MTQQIMDQILIGDVFRPILNRHSISDHKYMSDYDYTNIMSQLGKGNIYHTSTNNYQGFLMNFIFENEILYLNEIHANLRNIVEINEKLPVENITLEDFRTISKSGTIPDYLYQIYPDFNIQNHLQRTNLNKYSYLDLKIRLSFMGPLIIQGHKEDKPILVLFVKNGIKQTNLNGIISDRITYSIVELLICWPQLTIEQVNHKLFYPGKGKLSRYNKKILKKLLSSKIICKNKKQYQLSVSEESLLIKEICLDYLINKIKSSISTNDMNNNRALWVKWRPFFIDYLNIERLEWDKYLI